MVKRRATQSIAFLFFRTPSAPDEKSGLEHHYNKAMRLLNAKLLKYSALLYYNDVL
jgi:hypothetical protein